MPRGCFAFLQDLFITHHMTTEAQHDLSEEDSQTTASNIPLDHRQNTQQQQSTWIGLNFGQCPPPTSSIKGLRIQSKIIPSSYLDLTYAKILLREYADF